MLIVYLFTLLWWMHLAGGDRSPSFVEYIRKESHPVPRSWHRLGPVDKSSRITLRIGLKEGTESHLIEERLLQVSDPEHADYGNHLTIEEIHDLMRPNAQTNELVISWLHEHGIFASSANAAGNWISCTVTIGVAEKLLNTTYSYFGRSNGAVIARASQWSLPRILLPYIEVIHPTTSFFSPEKISIEATIVTQSFRRAQPRSTASSTSIEAIKEIDALCIVEQLCGLTGFTTPDCIRCLYGTYHYVPQGANSNSIGLCNFLNETNDRDDIFDFLSIFRPDAAASAWSFESVVVNNGSNYQGPYTPAMYKSGTNLEGDLDSEYILALSYPIPLTAYNVGGFGQFSPDPASGDINTNEPYLDWLIHILDQQTVPFVISSSYGDDEQTVPPSYAHKVCTMFAYLGLRGVSMLVASGDEGVGPEADQCISSQDVNRMMFLPLFPASCPWVTAVGATQGYGPEVATQGFGSGAGFSNYFPTPDYQRQTVEYYLSSLGDIYNRSYNPNGRAYPDVAAQGNNTVVIWDSQIQIQDGTSASTPILASVIALVNDVLITKGSPRLGFLNPWLYTKGYRGFNDITSGSSFGCGTEGFPARKGWDACTGWGSPNFTRILGLVR